MGVLVLHWVGIAAMAMTCGALLFSACFDDVAGLNMDQPTEPPDGSSMVITSMPDLAKCTARVDS